jgi:phosphoglycolate phosphatase
MNYKSTILFDLDGTLLATKRGVIGCVKEAFRELGYTLPPENTLDAFMGPPLENCFTDVCHLSHEQALKAIVIYRKHYEEHGLFDADVYDGIKELLSELKQKGFHLGVATSKCLRLSRIVLDHFDLTKYFEAIGGTPDNETAKWSKADSIALAMKNIPTSGKNNTVLIGDRKFDAFGAKDAGIDSIGVLFGYGTRDELEESPFSLIAETVSDLKKILFA